MRKKTISIVAIMLIGLLLIGGCTTPQVEETQEIPDTEEEMEEEIEYTGPGEDVSITLSEWKVTLSKKTINAGKVNFVVSNKGKKPHAIRIHDQQYSVNTDEIEKIEMTLKPGKYEIICPLPGHVEKGMKTTLTVQ
jgi:uncharacterized cupredoxin-like copper-binding protein